MNGTGHFKQNVRLEVDEMPKTLREVLATGRLESSEGPWFYNNVRGRNLNRDNAIAKWEDDIFLRTAGG